MLSSGRQETLDDTVTRLIAEYAQSLPARRPFDHRLSLRRDLAIESLSLVSLLLRLGEELEIDVVSAGIDLGALETVGDLVALGQGRRANEMRG